MTNPLADAKMFARQMDGDIPNEVGARNAQRAIACALIAIVEELRAMNERADAELEDLQLMRKTKGW